MERGRPWTAGVFGRASGRVAKRSTPPGSDPARAQGDPATRHVVPRPARAFSGHAAGRRWPCALLAVALRCLLRRHGLTYVEKRQPKHKDNLVEKTEEAIMMEYENQYSSGPHALKSKSRDRSRDSAQREGVDGESARLGHP